MINIFRKGTEEINLPDKTKGEPEKLGKPGKETKMGEQNATYLTSDVEIKGHLKFDGELTFEGKIEGEIQSEGTILLGESAVVNGNIQVNSVVVRGKVNGNITAKDKIDIKAKTELFGDVRAAKLVIEEGITFVGKAEVNPSKLSPTPPPRVPEIPKLSEPGRPGGR